MPKTSSDAQKTLIEERKAQILAAAVQVFAAKGYERATIAEIARRAGVAEGSIYNYFKNKGDLLISLPRQIILPQFENAGLPSAAGSPEEVLTRMVRTMLRAMRENIHIFRIMLSALPNMTKRMRQQYLEQVILHAIGIFRDYFQELIQRGVLRQDLDAAILAQSFVGMFFPTVLLPAIFEVELNNPADTEKTIRTCVQVFLRGVLATPNGPQPPRAVQESQ